MYSDHLAVQAPMRKWTSGGHISSDSYTIQYRLNPTQTPAYPRKGQRIQHFPNPVLPSSNYIITPDPNPLNIRVVTMMRQITRDYRIKDTRDIKGGTGRKRGGVDKRRWNKRLELRVIYNEEGNLRNHRNLVIPDDRLRNTREYGAILANITQYQRIVSSILIRWV